MSLALRKASPRATSAAISADGCWLRRDCVAGGEVVGDVVGGVRCFSAGAGEEATDDGASGARPVWPGAAMAGDAGRVVGGGPEMLARHSACVGGPPDLAAASGASCPDGATVLERTQGSPSVAISWRDENATMPRVNSIPAATRLRTTTGRIPRDSPLRRRAAS